MNYSKRNTENKKNTNKINNTTKNNSLLWPKKFNFSETKLTNLIEKTLCNNLINCLQREVNTALMGRSLDN